MVWSSEELKELIRTSSLPTKLQETFDEAKNFVEYHKVDILNSYKKGLINGVDNS